MASVFKRTYRKPNDKLAETANWYADVALPSGGFLRLPGFVDKAATEELGRKVQRLASLRVAGEQPDAAMIRWLDGLPGKLDRKSVV